MVVTTPDRQSRAPSDISCHVEIDGEKQQPIGSEWRIGGVRQLVGSPETESTRNCYADVIFRNKIVVNLPRGGYHPQGGMVGDIFNRSGSIIKYPLYSSDYK